MTLNKIVVAIVFERSEKQSFHILFLFFAFSDFACRRADKDGPGRLVSTLIVAFLIALACRCFFGSLQEPCKPIYGMWGCSSLCLLFVLWFWRGGAPKQCHSLTEVNTKGRSGECLVFLFFSFSNYNAVQQRDLCGQMDTPSWRF
jgi:hypothetical protein